MRYVNLNCSGSMDSKFRIDSGFTCSKTVTTAAVLRAKISNILCSNEIRLCSCRLPAIKTDYLMWF
jgi:hypothetical protein